MTTNYSKSYQYHDWQGTSLCQMGEYDASAKKWRLYRRADLSGSRLTRFHADPSLEHRFQNRDVFFTDGPANATGTWGIWKLDAHRNTTNPTSDYNSCSPCVEKPIEVVITAGLIPSLPSLLAMDSVKRKLTSPFAPQVLYAYREPNGKCRGYLLDASVFERPAMNSEDDLVSQLRVPMYELNPLAFLQLDSRVWFWNSTKMDEPDAKLLGYQWTADATTFLSLIVQQRFGSWKKFKETTGKEKRDWNAFTALQQLVQAVDADSLCNYGFSEKEIEQAKQQVISRAEAIVRGDDITTAVVDNYIERHAELKSQIHAQLSEDWEAKQSEREAEARERIKSLATEKESLENSVLQLTDAAETADARLKDLQSKTKRFETLEAEVTQKIDARLKQARTSYADILADLPFLPPSAGAPATATPEPTTQAAFSIPAPVTDVEKIDDIIDWSNQLADNLEDAGIKEDFALPFAQLLISADAAGLPLLFSGPSGAVAAQAFSCAVIGGSPILADLECQPINTVLTDLLKSNPDTLPFIQFTGILNNNRLSSLLSDPRLSRCRSLFSLGFSEDLELFVPSLVNHVFPVCTDLLFDSAPTTRDFVCSLPGASVLDKLRTAAGSRCEVRLPFDLPVPPFARKQINTALSRTLPLLCNGADEMKLVRKVLLLAFVPAIGHLATRRQAVVNYASTLDHGEFGELQDYLTVFSEEA